MQRIITCLNGRFLRADRARIPLTDRGFRFGDGIFETIRLEAGLPYQWPLHMTRMAEGLAALRIPAPAVDWATTAKKLIKKNRATEGFLRLSITRGSESTGYLPSPNSTAFWVMEYLPARPIPTAPAKLWLSTHARAPLAALPVNQKLAHGIGSTLALLEAKDNGCDEALQRTTNGLLSSAASANLFWVKNKALFTPALGTGCLNGTTRAAIMRLAPVPVHEIDAELSTIENAEALFLTNCRVGIWPVKGLQPTGLHFNAEHPLLAQLSELISNDRSNNKKETTDTWKKHS